MGLPLLNILIRTSYRPEAFARCIASVKIQAGIIKNVIISYDNTRALKYVPAGVETYPVVPEPDIPFHYNTYCNTLKAATKEGYILYLDDDDTLIPGSLQKIAPYLTGPGIIVPFLRNGWQRPSARLMRQRSIEKGRIGLPSIIFSTQIKDIANFTASESADYEFIRDIAAQVNLNWVDIPVVSSEKRLYGAME